MIIAATYQGGQGLVGSHAYTTLGVATLRNGVRLVKIRNPWGSEKWRGDYSDSSSLMTQDVRDQLDHRTDNDGVFYISLADYKRYFDNTTINYDVEGWGYDYFLALDDNGNDGERG